MWRAYGNRDDMEDWEAEAEAQADADAEAEAQQERWADMRREDRED